MVRKNIGPVFLLKQNLPGVCLCVKTAPPGNAIA